MGIQVCDKCGVILWCTISGAIQANSHKKDCPTLTEYKTVRRTAGGNRASMSGTIKRIDKNGTKRISKRK